MDSHQAEQFAAYWTAAQSTIRAFIRTVVPDLNQADEVMQRVAVALIRKFDKYDQSRPFVPWAIGMARYEVLYFRREWATDRHVFNDEIVDQLASRYQMLSTELDPVRKALEVCIDQLQNRSRRAIELRYREGMKSNAIGAKMGISSSAVRMLLSRVRATLLECILNRVVIPSSEGIRQ